MKEQYVGDENDYRKYALLRLLAGEAESSIGVCWMLTPPDSRADGNEIKYLKRPGKWAQFDPPLFELLRSLVGEPDRRRLSAIEDSDILPGAVYFDRFLSDAGEERRRYFEEARTKFASCDLVFFDPDNGIEVPGTAKGRKDSAKYIYWDEITSVYRAGQSIIIYQHFPREERNAFIARLGRRFLDAAPDATLWTFRTAHVVFLLAINPEHREEMLARANDVARRWPRGFIDPRPYHTPSSS